MADGARKVLADTWDLGFARGIEAAGELARLYPTHVADRRTLTPDQMRAVAVAAEQIARLIESLGQRRAARGGHD
jgi:hypothetical protein